MLTKQEFIEGTTLQLDLWGDQFASLERKVVRSARTKRREIEERLAALRRQKRRLKRRLREAALESKSDWEKVRGELEDAVHVFRTRAVDVYDHVHRV